MVTDDTTNRWVARTCRAGWAMGAAGLLLAASVMIAVARDPGELGTWAASALLLLVYGAFVADRFLAGVLSRIDRFEVASRGSESEASADAGSGGGAERDRRAA